MRVDLSRVKVDWRTADLAAAFFANTEVVDVTRVENWKPGQFAQERINGAALLMNDYFETQTFAGSAEPYIYENIRAPEPD